MEADTASIAIVYVNHVALKMGCAAFTTPK